MSGIREKACKFPNLNLLINFQVALKSLQTFPTEALKTPYFFNSLNGLLKLSGQAQKLKNNEVIPKVEIGA